MGLGWGRAGAQSGGGGSPTLRHPWPPGLQKALDSGWLAVVCGDPDLPGEGV